ncbi:MAG TPA: MlaD family protein [Thermoleophilaceae bacterium]|nr:MlaD family protein [Thermoleophilaceae bacterium]
MRRALAALVVVAAAAGGALLTLGAGGDSGSDSVRYKLVFDNAFGLVDGGDFRVGGVRAGTTTGFDLVKEKGEPPHAVVTAEVTEPGFADFREDATCEIRPQSLIGEYFVDCQPGSSENRLPTDGTGTVPLTQTASTIPVDVVQNIMRRPYRERLRLILTELGTGLAGRPEDLREVVARAHPGLRETTRVLAVLGRQNRIIENFIRDADTVIAPLEREKAEIARWIRETGSAAEITATRRGELSRSIDLLPEFLDELRPTMARLGDLSDESVPLLTDLEAGSDELNDLFTRLGPFAKASRPALDALGEAGRRGTEAFAASEAELDELRALSRDAPAFAKPLRQFLETMDDRERGLEDDPRAKAGAPPAPDPTAIENAGPFTGFEALWNYPFWQTLSVNMFDGEAHMVRLGLQMDPDCSRFQNNPSQAVIDRCNQWLGPNQPGITTADPTAGGSSAAALVAQDAEPAGRVGERRGPGEPEAGPLPGQRDISEPQIVLPPGVQELLDRLRVPRLPDLDELQDAPQLLPNAPTAPESAPTEPLLDFLLRP